MAERKRILNGARCRVMIQGKKIGWGTSVEVRESYDLGDAIVLDSIEVDEFVPNLYRVTFSMATITILGSTLKSLGLFPVGGNDSATRLRNALLQTELTIALEDNVTGTLTHLVEGAKIEEQSISVQAGQISGTQVSGKARRVRDAIEL